MMAPEPSEHLKVHPAGHCQQESSLKGITLQGFITLHRKILEWEWYDDHNTFRVFIHCLLRANHKPKTWRGIDIPRGSFYTSLDTLSSEIGLSNKQIRTSLDKLQRTGELAGSGMARGRMITIPNYDSYQSEGSLKGSEKAGKGQGKGRVGATNNNDNNDNNEILIPDGINATAWNEWIAYRKSKKKKVSQKAAKKQFELLTNYAFEVQQQIIDQSIQNDYQGLFEPKGNSNENNQRPNQPRQSLAERTAGQARAIWAECEAEEAGERNVGENDAIVPAQVELGGRGDAG